MSTKKSRAILVRAVQCMGYALDGEEYEPWISDEWLKGRDPDDDGRIGGKSRTDAAAALRTIRADQAGRDHLKKEIGKLRSSMSKNPGRWRITAGPAPRLRPVTVNRKGTRAKRHRDCCYCGTGLSGKVCGVCKEAGIDGQVIRGTEARKGTTFVQWNIQS